MEAILERLRHFEFFRDFDPDAIDDIAAAGRWLSYPGGSALFFQNDPSRNLFFNLSGRLIVARTTPEGKDVVGYVRAGEPVGEMSMLSGAAHSASVFALRDTEVFALPVPAAERILREHGEFARALASLVLQRTDRSDPNRQRAAPRTFALIGTSRSIDIDAYAQLLAERIRAMGLRVVCETVGEAAPDSHAFDITEEDCDIMLLPARIEDSAWYKFVLRQADRFLVFARRDARPPKPFPMTTQAGARARQFRLVDLIMLYEGLPSGQISEWIDAIGAARIFHLRTDGCRDRLARVIAGKSVGLVLSGGGARAYAHIGAVRALREMGVPIDFVCGASMGAIIAACIARGWDDDEIETRINDAFVQSNPLGDYVIPVVALTRGRIVDERLERHFGDALIEDLSLPFFCVSSDIVTGEARVHRRGSLACALRASIALPGILPPVIDGDALLVDGAVINNFPTDIMANGHRGLNIGIDVARRGAIDVDAFRDPPNFLGWVRRFGVSGTPPIVSLLMRTATARHEATYAAHPPDIMIAPTVPGVELRDWEEYHEAVSDGYKTTRAAIEANMDVLAPIV